MGRTQIDPAAGQLRASAGLTWFLALVAGLGWLLTHSVLLLVAGLVLGLVAAALGGLARIMGPPSAADPPAGALALGLVAFKRPDTKLQRESSAEPHQS